ncbi:hypothetical protein ACFLU5_00960 [Bacteroidota bacterium]
MKTERNLSGYIRSVASFIFVFHFIFMYSNSIAQSGQNKKKLRTRMSLSYNNNANNTKTIIATVFIVKDRQRVPVINEKVLFYIGEISDGIKLDSAITNLKGEAQLDFPEQYDFPLDEETNSITITADFQGNDTHSARSTDINFKEILMELFLSEVSSTKTVSVRAYEIGNGSGMLPAEDASVSFYIPRLFGDQKIGESDIEEGKSYIEFPENIAGDSIGNITVIARIEEHDLYGNVERKVSNFRWGSKKPIEEDKALMTIEISIPTRGLWHSNAPMWMIVTLIILLAGVWGHYLYVILQLVKLARLKNRKMPD